MSHKRIAPSAPAASAVAELLVYEQDRDMPRISIPRSEIHLVARLGPSTQNGAEVHALGGRLTVQRKLIRSGQQLVLVRFHLGAPEAMLGASASELAGRIVAIEDLWGDAATRRLCDRLANAHDPVDAAAILDSAITERIKSADRRRAHARLALDAAHSLTRASVNAVAADLGVSERQLRRVFREIVGVSPKAFARLTRFHRALLAARADTRASWADIAAVAGYYDQAHLIAEFHTIAGVTPRALLGELGAAPSVG